MEMTLDAKSREVLHFVLHCLFVETETMLAIVLGIPTFGYSRLRPKHLLVAAAPLLKHLLYQQTLNC